MTDPKPTTIQIETDDLIAIRDFITRIKARGKWAPSLGAICGPITAAGIKQLSGIPRDREELKAMLAEGGGE